MGQKVNPFGFRLGIIYTGNSIWYAEGQEYKKYIKEDIRLRKYIMDKFTGAGVAKVFIERPAKNVRVTIFASRPGVILGKKGGDIDSLRKELADMLKVPLQVKVQEIKKPDLDAKLVAEGVAQQLERRIMFRRAMKSAVQRAFKAGALGIKVNVSGRLGGSEIARTEWYREGRVPLHTLRADIDFGQAIARTTYGVIGVKVWIFKGEVFGDKEKSQTGEESV
jgi:small subunit ribosomal protein S3